MKNFFGAVVFFGVLLSAEQVGVSAISPEDAISSSGIQGGLVVHVGCTTGRFTVGLRPNGRFLVQGLCTDAANAEKAREYIRSRGVYGQVSVDTFGGEHLPYADGIVKLVVVSEEECEVSLGEIERVLEPRGVAILRGSRETEESSLEMEPISDLPGWVKMSKKWPNEIDEWSHYLHGPDGNQVAKDTVVGPPMHIKWRAKPYWGRQHRYGNKTAMVSANGRLFYVSNEVEPSIEKLPDRPFLVARDAFSGVLLWKQPIRPNLMKGYLEADYESDDCFLHEPAFPMETKVVAGGDRLYVGFGRQGELLALDAATGKLLTTYTGSENTEEVLYAEGKLLTVSAPDGLEKWKESPRSLNDLIRQRQRADIIRVIDAESGSMEWEYDTTEDGKLKVSPVIRGDAVYAIAGETLLCLDLESGEQRWEAPLVCEERKKQDGLRSIVYLKGPAICDHLVAADDIIILLYTMGRPYSTKTFVDTYSTERGQHLWRYACSSPERAGAVAYVVDDIVWVHGNDSQKPLVGLDLKTGEEKKHIDCGKVFGVGHHHRCYGNRATTRFLMTGRRGVEFIGFETGETTLNHWIRGKCRFGVLPCNGYLYTIPHACSCYPFSTLKGYSALAGGTDRKEISRPDEERLERGPAYGKTGGSASSGGDGADWPTHRHDASRSGSTSANLPRGEVTIVWQTPVGGTPTALTAVGEGIFLAVAEEHRVCALSKEDGTILWSFTAGGRVDGPPTLHRGLALFGSADGYVYCLRADTGELVWRFLAAQCDRRIVSDEQLESVWPVHGAVLVQNDIAYFSAGRTSLLDDGIVVYALDPETGEVVSRNVIHDPYAEAEAAMLKNDGRNYNGDIGVLQEVLVGDGTSVYLRQLKLNARCVPEGKSDQVISGNGLLNPAWMSRIGWYFGTPTKETRHTNADPNRYDIFESPRQGQYLVFDEDSAYSVRLYPNIGKFARYFEPGGKGYRIFADDNNTSENHWSRYVPIRVEAMVACAGETLFLAGTPDIVDPDDPWGAIEGRKGGLMWSLAAKSGEKLSELELDSPPVFDGLMVADERLFMSLRNGDIVCCE